MYKYSAIGSLIGGVGGIVIACEKKSGFIPGVGYFIVFSLVGSLAGFILDKALVP